MNRQKGFTVIELLVVAGFLIAVAVLGYIQLSKITNEAENTTRRTAINAIYYSLEEDFYKRNQYYPEKIEDNTLPTMDKELLKDSKNIKLNETGSLYRYEPANCKDGKCKSYTLRTILIKQADFIKESRNK